MAIYLTVDGGTTNTRIYLVCEGEIIDFVKLSVGARMGADALKPALRGSALELLRKHGLRESDVKRILASGMITSEYGLCNLPHVILPVGVRELHETLYETVLEEVSSIPFCFVRGVRSACDSLEGADIMRGEETELMGLLDGRSEAALYVLPGSHSKHIRVDGEGRIRSLRTMLTGELFAAVIQHTVLRDAADPDRSVLRREALLRGYRYAKAHGINEALFKTRILRNVFGEETSVCYSFLLGAVLCDEVGEIVKAEEKTVVLGGQKQMRDALAILIGEACDKAVTVLCDREVDTSTARGAVRIYET